MRLTWKTQYGAVPGWPYFTRRVMCVAENAPKLVALGVHWVDAELV
jgi:hypothetical protein